MEENNPLTHNQIEEWQQFLTKETSLSSQEAAVFVRTYQMSDSAICDDLSIDDNHLNTVRSRVSDKVERANATSDIGTMWSGARPWTKRAIPFGHALVGCSGPRCDEDIDTDVTNHNFDNFYTLKVNLYDNSQEMSNVRTLNFCSRECLREHERLANKQRGTKQYEQVLVVGGRSAAVDNFDAHCDNIRFVSRSGSADSLRGFSADLVILTAEPSDECMDVISAMEAEILRLY